MTSMISTSEAVTRQIAIRVRAHYVEEQSDPAGGGWFFVYHVTIANEGTDTVQLMNRHWIITDANGHVEEVKGPGVVGEQPVLEPGQSFQYSSACPLSTPFGTMEGSYGMVTGGGERFDAEISPFRLSEPYSIN